MNKKGLGGIIAVFWGFAFLVILVIAIAPLLTPIIENSLSDNPSLDGLTQLFMRLILLFILLCIVGYIYMNIKNKSFGSGLN